MKKIFYILSLILIMGFAYDGFAQKKDTSKVKSKFYDFSDQLIDGEVKKPSGLFIDSRQKVKFDRLLRLKKSFIQNMLQTSQENVFK